MGRDRFTQVVHNTVANRATNGGTQSATRAAEQAYQNTNALNPLVDPKGLPHMGPIRESRMRFDPRQDGTFELTCGPSMAVELLFDTTGSMGDNVDIAFAVLPKAYSMLAEGRIPVLGRYDVHMAHAIFGDIEEHPRIPALCRTQYEMNEKISMQMASLVPGKSGAANNKEDPQYGLFAAAYLTQARINRYGLMRYHFTVSDEPAGERVTDQCLRQIFGDGVFDAVASNGHEISSRSLPGTAKIVKDLQEQAHAFFLFVPTHPVRDYAERQWRGFYGDEHFIVLPEGTRLLHFVEAVIIGLTEGVLDLSSAANFLRSHGASQDEARKIVQSVAHIPLGAQAALPNFHKLPKAGDRFASKTDLWPIDPSSVPSPGIHPESPEADDDDDEDGWL